MSKVMITDCDIDDLSSSSTEASKDLLDELPLLPHELYKEGGRNSWDTYSTRTRSWRKRYSLYTAFTTIALLASVIFIGDAILQQKNMDLRCIKKLSPWSPIHETIGHADEVLDSDVTSIYTGEYNEASDDAWYTLWHYPATGITEDKLPLLNKSLNTDWQRHRSNSTKFPGQIKAYIEVFHRLHCLSFLRKLAFRDQYDPMLHPGTNHFFHMDEAKLQRHTLHCVDNMRWGFECTADVTPYLFEKVTAKDGKTFPILRVRRPAKCRSWEDLQRYAMENTEED
ncbi:hypothetical protein GQ53DRAFT_816941 [Thozetella sp. PMI_491]|nr:hypothetical protein GQ53DRAFT_816941 [Thozetella sp. PMI_491]